MAIDLTLRRDLPRLLTDGEVDDNFVALRTAIQGVLDGRGKAEGYAGLAADGRLPLSQAPIVTATLLPTDAHDLNTYVTPGPFYQGTASAATLAANYPIANVTGFLDVETFGSATLQRFSTRTAPYQEFWRVKTGATAWSAWKESIDHTTGLVFQGVMAASQDLNTYTQRGIWIVTSSGIAGGGTNFPIGQSGVLMVYSAGYPGGTTATGANQVYIASNSNQQFFRSLVGGTWSAWERVATLTSGRLPAEQAPSAILLPITAHSLDDIRTAGVYAQNATAGAVAGTSYPAPFAGLLEVHCAEGVSAANLLWQEYTVYGVEGGSPVGFGGRRYWRSCSNKVTGTWGPWREVARASEAMTKIALTAATDADTLTADNTWWTWSASAAMGSNFPPVPVKSGGSLSTIVMTAAYMVQTCIVVPSTGRRPIEYRRAGNATTWSNWKLISPVQLASDLPTADCGDCYVDGEGWYTWTGTAYWPLFAAKDHGQCRFGYSSATNCVLIPVDGNGLVINGRQYRIPAAGILVPATGLAASTQYYAYAKDDGSGGIAIDLLPAASNPHSKHTDGVEIRTGNPAYTLVGYLITTPSAQFQNTPNGKYVLSWFNRRLTAMVEAATNNTTASTTYVKLQPGLYTLMWAGDSLQMHATGIVRPGVAGGGGGYMVMTVNGTAISGGQGYTLASAAGAQQASVTSTAYTANSDGYYNFAPYGFTSAAANPVTFYHDVSALALT
ncbi:pyocin knob domain-containing protein [Achromobacter sp. E1]|uniref:pyocin knob domain-containing protein n=1 Tax=Achromobacter sp. E1 TaxID=3141581 RepID=UPI0030D0C55D